MSKELIAVKLINREIKRLEKRLEKIGEEMDTEHFSHELHKVRERINNLDKSLENYYDSCLELMEERNLLEKKLSKSFELRLKSIKREVGSKGYIEAQIQELNTSILCLNNYQDSLFHVLERQRYRVELYRDLEE